MTSLAGDAAPTATAKVTSSPPSSTPGMTSQTMTSSTTSQMTPEEQLRYRQERAALWVQACFVRFLFVFQGITQLYVTQVYLVDFAFSGFSSFTRTALKAWAWHLCLVGAVNWLCLLHYRSVYDPAKHRPETTAPPDHAEQHTLPPTHRDSENLNRSSHSTAHNLPDAKDNPHSTDDPEVTNSSSDQEGSEGRPLPWTYCERCQMHTPPRTRHCKKCEVCVIRRDHHCELVGVCVGHRNQRFFVVLANYGLFVNYIGAYMTITFLYHHHPEGSSLWNYFLPYAFFQGIWGNISALQLLLTYHAIMLVIFCPLCTVYFLSEMSVILQGKTMREVLKRRKSIKVTTDIHYNLRVVFGERWWLGFLFPTHLLLPHAHTGMDFPGVTELASEAELEQGKQPPGPGQGKQLPGTDKKQD